MKDRRLEDVGLLIVRVGLGLIVFYFGTQKVFGWFGGEGFNGTLGNMARKWGVGSLWAVLAMAAEFLGGLGLILGLLTRVAAFGVMCAMAVATFKNVSSLGLHVIAVGDGPSRIFFPLTLCLLAVGILLMGGGPYSLDQRFWGRARGKW